MYTTTHHDIGWYLRESCFVDINYSLKIKCFRADHGFPKSIILHNTFSSIRQLPQFLYGQINNSFSIHFKILTFGNRIGFLRSYNRLFVNSLSDWYRGSIKQLAFWYRSFVVEYRISAIVPSNLNCLCYKIVTARRNLWAVMITNTFLKTFYHWHYLSLRTCGHQLIVRVTGLSASLYKLKQTVLIPHC